MSTLKVLRITPDAKLPFRATSGAAAFDLHSIEDGHVTEARPNVFSTGLKVEVPEGHVLLIFSRSGHAFKSNVRLSNCVGVIDSDYRGDVKVKLTADVPGALDVKAGDRIAQAMLVQLPSVEITEVTSLSSTDRGDGGFGSTGA